MSTGPQHLPTTGSGRDPEEVASGEAEPPSPFMLYLFWFVVVMVTSDGFDLPTCSPTARVRGFCEARNVSDLESNGSKICPYPQNRARDIMTKKRNQFSDNSGTLVGLYNNLRLVVF